MEMPSTPRYQCTPSELPVYWWFETSWKPPSCTFITTRVAMAKPSVTSDTIRASAYVSSFLKFLSSPNSPSKAAPTAGRSTSSVRKGTSWCVIPTTPCSA